MKKVLGLDLGTTSIGWALVKEATIKNEKSSIIDMGVRVVPLTTDEQKNFEKGRSITTNADRTQKRGARRNLQRFKLRRKNLLSLLREAGIFSSNTLIAEDGKDSTHTLLKVRAEAARIKIPLEDFGRVLLAINKKRGYKSNRKANTEEEGEIVDAMGIAKTLYRENITPGQYTHRRMEEGKFIVPDFYRSDLVAEFDKIWTIQRNFFPEIFTELHKSELEGKNKNDTADYFKRTMGIERAEFKGKRDEKKAQEYQWRALAGKEKVDLEISAEILTSINNQINSASGYLGKIGDRSKILAFNDYTVGQYMYQQIKENPNARLKNQVFYRQDYEDEFDKIWKTQAQYHPELTDGLKERLRNTVIFYQRPLKSQKSLISLCEFENREIEIPVNGKVKKQRIGHRVAPKSSPIFQEFKIWQVLNNLKILVNGENPRTLEFEEKITLYDELSLREKLTKTEVAKILGYKRGMVELQNYDELSGNITRAKFYDAFNQIVELSGHDQVNLKRNSASEVINAFRQIFKAIGVNQEIISLKLDLPDKELIKQPYYELWHLLYSYEGDDSRTGNESLIQNLINKFGFNEEGATILSKVRFELDYGSLSAKAMKKILPHLRQGLEYSQACEKAGYYHSHSLTKEQQDQRNLKAKLELLPKNSLRNPVVEKILNQMVNVINAIIDEYGKPDEVRVELARELKKNAEEREMMTKAINKAKRDHENYKKIIAKEFGLPYVSRNDLIKYKLYKELAKNGYKTLYTDRKIDHDKLFSKEIDVEHIIPKARLFDDSFTNKTLEYRDVNLEKSNVTAYDYVASKGEKKLNQYIGRVNGLDSLSPRKKKLLLMSEENIPDNFLERDLRNSQYIAKKAIFMLSKVFPSVVSTTGKVTHTLRTDWQLIDVLKDLNWSKYHKLGLTEYIENKTGHKLRKIKDWDKRNDHRHHAMDALAVAFTTRSHIQYLNNLNAKSKKGSSIYGIRSKLMFKDEYGKWRFYPPIPIKEFRSEAKKHLSQLLVSNKAKNKVTTRNTNRIKTKNGVKEVIQATPRGQLHNETIYGTVTQYMTKENVQVNGSFDRKTIEMVARKIYREALLKRLDQFDGKPKKAFTGKNSLTKNPVYTDEFQTIKVPERVKLVWQEDVYTVRKEITPDLNVKKVIDPKVKEILMNRLEQHGNEPKIAFSNLDEDPIWFNKKAGIPIKRVKITGVANALPIHVKRSHHGNPIIDEIGNEMEAAYVSPSNNHHVAIYQDADGGLFEETVSFFEAVVRKNRGLPLINPTYENGAKLLFTMKQNEYFVFPNEETGFNPKEIDLLNPENYHLISPNLFRIQKIASKYYVFRHHLETEINDDTILRGSTWKRLRSPSNIFPIEKVRLNHLGKIVQVGEF